MWSQHWNQRSEIVFGRVGCVAKVAIANGPCIGGVGAVDCTRVVYARWMPDTRATEGRSWRQTSNLSVSRTETAASPAADNLFYTHTDVVYTGSAIFVL